MAGKKGRGGRPPKTKEAKVLAGTFRKSRATADAPDPEYAVPETPPLSCKRAEELWQFWLGQLGPGGRNVLTAADGVGLVEVCEIQAELERRRANGKPTPAGLTSQLRSWCGLYGISPADRQRIPAVSQPGDGVDYVKPRGAK